jgi:thymidine phosphorylase
MQLPQEIIRLKRDGKTLSREQIQCFVQGLVTKQFTDAQVGAMAMAIFQQGMSTEETVALTLQMMHSGDVLSWPEIDGPIVDKHSTGGVGDKVSFMLAAIVAACGAYVPMISGRGLGHTGGTADKLESIAGINVEPDVKRFKSIVKELGVAIITQTNNLAPADKRLYAIRDVTATVESIPLITASILSKKLAAGLDALVMDVKVGNGAMMSTMDNAQALAHSIVNVAEGAGVKTEALITDMNQVLGTTAGNAVEMIETLDYLSGKYRDPRLHEVVVALAVAMLKNTQLATSTADAEAKINQVLDSGKAAEVFAKMIHALGGPADLFDKPWDYMPKANCILEIQSPRSGFIKAMDTRDIGMTVVALGGGRLANDQAVDHSVGFDCIVGIGSKVNNGDVVARVHADSAEKATLAARQYLDALTFTDEYVPETPVIYQSITR